MKVHFAVITHRHGNNFYAARTREQLDSQIAEYCREWWKRDGPGLSGDYLPDGEDVIERYFDWCSNIGCEESLETTELEVE